MAEYASKGVAGTGLGLGIAGTALALLNNGGDGLLNGLLGGGNRMTELMAENTLLKSQRYTDQEVSPLRVDMARMEEKMSGINQKIDLTQQITDGKIAQVAQAANGGISQLENALRCLRHTVDGIAATYVPAARVTPLPAPNPFPPVPPYGPYLPFPPFPPPAPPVTGGTTQTPTQTQAGG